MALEGAKRIAKTQRLRAAAEGATSSQHGRGRGGMERGGSAALGAKAEMKLDGGWVGGVGNARSSRAGGKRAGRGGEHATAPKNAKQDGASHPW
jgi:hypothetical protein